MERELTAKDVHRVIAFVVDDMTIPYADLATVRQILTDFVDNRMHEGDLVAAALAAGPDAERLHQTARLMPCPQ